MSSTHPIFSEYNWNTFTDSCLSLFTTEFYLEDYILLNNYIDMYGFKKELFVQFVEKAHEDEYIEYQECLNDIIDICLNGSRYSKEFLDVINEVIYYLLEKDTMFPENMLLNPRYENHVTATLEDEVVDYEIRGKFIDTFHEKMNIDSYCNWSNIVAVYWEDIDYSSTNYSNITRLRCLKYFSNYLKNTYPHNNDN